MLVVAGAFRTLGLRQWPPVVEDWKVGSNRARPSEVGCGGDLRAEPGH